MMKFIQIVLLLIIALAFGTMGVISLYGGAYWVVSWVLISASMLSVVAIVDICMQNKEL